jgi:hypothetical protein
MSADAAATPLSKVDSAVQGLSSSPPKDAKDAKRRASSSVPGVYNITDLGMSSHHASVGFPTSGAAGQHPSGQMLTGIMK